MIRVLRFATAALLMFCLAAAHGGADVVRTLADDGDDTSCCCPSPEQCHCTANCCHHGPSQVADRSSGRSNDPPSLRSSITCHFPELPDGSLAAAATHGGAPGTVALSFHDPAPPGPSGRRMDQVFWCQYDAFRRIAPPRAPPSPRG